MDIEPPGGHPDLCLLMIVRDEAPIVRRALDNVARLVDRWLICDTGSVDDTPGIISAHMRGLGIPGELIHETWQDFGHNKSVVQRRAFSDVFGGAEADQRIVHRACYETSEPAQP